MKKKDFSQIQNDWEKIQTLNIRDKWKALRTITHDISVSYKKEAVTVEQLEFYIKIMKQSVKALSFPQKASLFLSKLIADWLVLTGNDQCEIILKISNEIPVETATIAISDPAYFDDINALQDYSERNYLHLMNEGKFFIFSTGSDGIYKVQLRIVDALEPVLTPKEFTRVIDTSESAIMHVPSGTITIADPSFFNSEKYCLRAFVTPGNYKISVYHFYIPKKIESFYIVLSKTDKQANNNLSKVYEFGFPLS